MNTIGTVTQKVFGTLEQHVIQIGIVGTGVTINGGSGSDSATIQKIAFGSLGGHRVVCSYGSDKAEYATNLEELKSKSVLGITTGAVSDGSIVTIKSAGEIEENSWSWTPQQLVYLSTNGLLTQTPPVSGYSLSIGFAVSSTKIAINIGFPILLS